MKAVCRRGRTEFFLSFHFNSITAVECVEIEWELRLILHEYFSLKNSLRHSYLKGRVSTLCISNLGANYHTVFSKTHCLVLFFFFFCGGHQQRTAFHIKLPCTSKLLVWRWTLSASSGCSTEDWHILSKKVINTASRRGSLVLLKTVGGIHSCKLLHSLINAPIVSL